MRSYTKHAEGHLGMGWNCPSGGMGGCTGAVWEGPDQPALALFKKTRTHTESRNLRRGRTRPLNGPRCCPQTRRADRRARKALGYSAPLCTARLPLKFLLILIIADHRGRSGTLWEMKAFSHLWTKWLHKKIFKSFPFPLPETVLPCLTDP